MTQALEFASFWDYKAISLSGTLTLSFLSIYWLSLRGCFYV
ncbi:MAG: hypothetical protein ACK41S_05160 [Planctomycetota bacterium]